MTRLAARVVQMDESMGEWLRIAAGVKQGRLLSPTHFNIFLERIMSDALDWLVGCFGLNGSLRQYFSLYRAVSQRQGERKEKR